MATKTFNRFENADDTFWKTTGKMPSITILDTKYTPSDILFIHEIIKIKTVNNVTSALPLMISPHLNYLQEYKTIWKTWALWWKELAGFNIKEEYIIKM